MALTKEDLVKIRGTVDEAIAQHPRFDQLRNDTVDEIAEVMQDSLQLVEKRFDLVETRFTKRFDLIENRLDNLRIVSEA